VGSPHKERDLIGEDVDLDLLFQSPQRYMDLSGGIKRNQAFEVQQWWEREKATQEQLLSHWGRRGGLK
jgi:hypothetical protein